MRIPALPPLVALCLTLSTIRVPAGDVIGSVVDESGAVLPGATVTLAGQGLSRTALTRTDGGFLLANVRPGTYSLEAARPLFVTRTQHGVEVGEEPLDLGTIGLAVAGVGETLVVSASRTESMLVDAPATLTVIDRQALASTPAQNFGDLLRAVPGMNVIQTSARDVQMTSRQATATLSTSTLVLVDGRSLYMDFFGFVLWDLVPTNPDEIRQIEVVRGPASVVWGANALTGVVNIVTRTPREAVGAGGALQAGRFGRDGGSREADGAGHAWGGSASIARAPSERWSFRLSGGYFDSDPYSRPVGTVPLAHHPLDPSVETGGAPYPADSATGSNAFENTGTAQPKLEARVDQELGSGGVVSYGAGYAGSEGIIHTGIGPFDLQRGSYLGYGSVGFSRNALKLAAFVNWLDAKAPNLLLTDPTTLEPVRLDFRTQTYDLDVGHVRVLGGRHALSYGGNLRRNEFDITLASRAAGRTEAGAYVQDEVVIGRVRLSVGARVDKFANIEAPVFSPRVSLAFKPGASHSLRASYNRAFRSPSAINNWLDQEIFAPVAPIDLRPLVPLLSVVAPPLAGQVPSEPVRLIVRNVGNEVGSTSGRTPLSEEHVDAFEIAYTGTFRGRTTLGVALYQNTQDDNINFVGVSPSGSFPQGLVPPYDTYTPENSAETGIPGPLYAFLLQARLLPPLPRTVSTYMNLGPIRQRGIEVSLDHRFNSHVSATANYSFQDTPEVLDPGPDQIRYPVEEVTVPARHRANLMLTWDTDRLVGQASLGFTDRAFWNDVLQAPWHGYTEAYTLLNASFGVKWSGGRLTTTLKGTNLLDERIQQHVYGDVLRRALFAELRCRF